MEERRLAHVLFCAILLVVGAGGCVSTPEEEGQDSDIPWNTPQQWEGVMPMPGFQPSN